VQKERQAFLRLKEREEKRERRKKKGLRKWDPGIGEGVLVETCRLSDASRGVTHKFTCPYDGPYYISRLVSPSIFEISDAKGKVKGIINKGALKKFVTR
jgi:hypothetical protein